MGNFEKKSNKSRKVMAIPNVDKLYECGSALSAAKAGEFPKYEEQFKTILSGVHGDNNTKKLASQFTSRFFSKYPAYANDSLDAILDLCEDDNVDIRKQAIKDLPSLCREMKEFLPKIADVLSQLLQTEDKGRRVLLSIHFRPGHWDYSSFKRNRNYSHRHRPTQPVHASRRRGSRAPWRALPEESF